jgi:CheY-like chemotaxis protein
MTSVGSPTRDVLLLNDPMLPESPGLSGIAQPRTADVLIVEDNDYNVDVAKQMLELLGHRVTVAFDGWEAVSLIISRDCKRAWLPTSGKPFDLVLMDLRMPGMSGLQAAQAIRMGGGPNDGIPILAFTADPDSGDLDGVFQGTVRKPLQLGPLLVAVMGALDEGSAPGDQDGCRQAS